MTVPAVPVRQQHASPLIAGFLAPGHTYDIRTGLVHPPSTPSTRSITLPPPGVSISKETLCASCSGRECICNDGVYVNGVRQKDPKRPGYGTDKV